MWAFKMYDVIVHKPCVTVLHYFYSVRVYGDSQKKQEDTMGRFGSLRASFTSSVEAMHNILHLAATASPSLAAVSRMKRNSSGNKSKTSFSPITQVKEYCHSGGDPDQNSSEEEGVHTTKAPQLHWNEARRTCSDPTAELHRCCSQLSICSLSSHSGDDDVFLAEPGTAGTTATTICETVAGV